MDRGNVLISRLQPERECTRAVELRAGDVTGSFKTINMKATPEEINAISHFYDAEVRMLSRALAEGWMKTEFMMRRYDKWDERFTMEHAKALALRVFAECAIAHLENRTDHLPEHKHKMQ
jgi:hypothetical protein